MWRRATNLTITATRHVFNNDGVDIDSTQHAVVEDVYYDGGDDAVALKSGLCKAGVEFATPTANVRIENFIARTRDACFCTGSESGVISTPQSVAWRTLCRYATASANRSARHRCRLAQSR